MDDSEREICNYLKALPEQFISIREICRRAGGKWRFRDDPKWAIPVLTRMVDKGYLESDAGGHFRIRPPDRKGKDKKKVWMSPEMRELLERGKSLGGGGEIQDLGEFEE